LSAAFDEAAWWGDCCNTFHEEEKQTVYARRMGLSPVRGAAHPPTFDLRGRSVVDVGGGPASLLLKCLGGAVRGRALVACDPLVVWDPGEFPGWVRQRYRAHGVALERLPAEELAGEWDEAWCYNVLQHVSDPEEVVRRMLRCAGTVRIFEWLNVKPYPGHPHELRAADLDRWLGWKGGTARVDERGAVGDAYFGVFPGAPRGGGLGTGPPLRQAAR
jgi:hypothetical protein